MRPVNGNFSFLRHMVAAMIAMAVLTALPLLLYFGVAIMDNDPGAPMMIVFVPLLSLFFAVSMTLLGYFPYASFCQYLARRKSISSWLPVLGFALLSLLIFGLWGASPDRGFLAGLGTLPFAGAFSTLATLGFAAYWLALVFKTKPATIPVMVSSEDKTPPPLR